MTTTDCDQFDQVKRIGLCLESLPHIGTESTPVPGRSLTGPCSRSYGLRDPYPWATSPGRRPTHLRGSNRPPLFRSASPCRARSACGPPGVARWSRRSAGLRSGLRRFHLDEQVIRDAVGRGDVDIEQRDCRSRWGSASHLGDRDLQHVAADEHGLGGLAAGDHVGVVDAEVLAFEQDGRFVALLGRPAVPGQQRGAKLSALRAEDPRVVVVVGEGDADHQPLGRHHALELVEPLERDLVFLGAILALDLGAVEGILGGDELAAQVEAFSRSDFWPSPTSLVRNQLATVMNSILGMKLGITIERRALALAGLDALLLAGRVGEAAVRAGGRRW